MSDQIAHKAAQLWGISPDAVKLAARRENVVYRARTTNGEAALRLHRPGYRTAQELQSEMQWMQHLAQGGLAVPLPIASASGALIEMVDDTPISVLKWLPGAPSGAGDRLDVSDPLAFVNELGRSMARLHDLSDAWTPPVDFTRPSWDLNGLLGDDPLWGRFWENPDLTQDQAAILQDTRQKAHDLLSGMEDRLDYGLIHADIITENILVEGTQVSLIDFDDGGWGFRAFELATFLMRFLNQPNYADLRDALLGGYATRQAVDPQMLDFFILLRALTYPGWIIPRRHEPGGAERSTRAIRTALPLAQKFLQT
jgi:Ser/Thr protein kinase RdoA (MazF antagonist)